jgi:Fe-S cluster biogenesis protein NfuA
MVNRPLFEGRSWLFSNFEEAAGSPLAELVFSVDSVETLLIHDSTAVVTKTGPKGLSDWEALAKEVGGALRKTLVAGTDLISKEIIAKIPSEEVVREEIQKVIDTEVNPGVAGHGGRITLTAVTGNTVIIEMGGGCQGCSAADLTLKQGIHSAFRKAVPYIGAIYDETDHAAGSNPYYR